MMNQGRGDGQDRDEISRYAYDNDDHIVAKWHDNGKDAARDRIDYVYAQGNPVAETGTAIQGGAYTAIDTKNYALFENYGKDFPGGTTSSYTVKGGETLQGIANTLWGNPSQWYVLAEANGLSGTEELKAGQVLVVPSNGKSELINSQTHKTYNENEIVGSKLPNLKSPPPKGKKCGGFLQILVIIVAIVVTIYTAGAAAGLMSVATGATTTFGAGLAVLGGAGGLAGMGAAMIGGAIGSIVSQGVGMAVGIQEHFSWKSVAMSAIGSGVAAGIGGTGVFNLTPSTAINTGLTAMASNVATQGISIAFGQQKNFNWRAVAASGVAAAASSAVGDLLKGVDITGDKAMNEFLTKTARSVTSSVTSQLVETGKVDWRSVAITEVGNYINSKVNEKWGTGMANVLAESVVGAGLARLRHQDPLAGAIGGAVGSIVGQMSRSAFAAVGIDAEQVAAEGQFSGARSMVNKDGTIAGTDIKLPWEVPVAEISPPTSNKALETVFNGQGFSSSNILDSIVSAVGSGLGSAFAQWAGRDTRAAATAGGGAAARAYQTTIKDGTAAAFDKLVKAKADKAEEIRKAFAPKPAKDPFAMDPVEKLAGDITGVNYTGEKLGPDMGLGLVGVPGAATARPQPTAMDIADATKALYKQAKADNPTATAAELKAIVNAQTNEQFGIDGLMTYKPKDGDGQIKIARNAYGRDEENLAYAANFILNDGKDLKDTQVQAGKDVLMFSKDVVDSLANDEKASKDLDKMGRQLISAEGKVRLEILAAQEKKLKAEQDRLLAAKADADREAAAKQQTTQQQTAPVKAAPVAAAAAKGEEGGWFDTLAGYAKEAKGLYDKASDAMHERKTQVWDAVDRKVAELRGAAQDGANSLFGKERVDSAIAAIGVLEQKADAAKKEFKQYVSEKSTSLLGEVGKLTEQYEQGKQLLRSNIDSIARDGAAFADRTKVTLSDYIQGSENIIGKDNANKLASLATNFVDNVSEGLGTAKQAAYDIQDGGDATGLSLLKKSVDWGVSELNSNGYAINASEFDQRVDTTRKTQLDREGGILKKPLTGIAGAADGVVTDLVSAGVGVVKLADGLIKNAEYNFLHSLGAERYASEDTVKGHQTIEALKTTVVDKAVSVGKDLLNDAPGTLSKGWDGVTNWVGKAGDDLGAMFTKGGIEGYEAGERTGARGVAVAGAVTGVIGAGKTAVSLAGRMGLIRRRCGSRRSGKRPALGGWGGWRG
ncbi:LysM peptidoglycan-binding domain-containing protein [Pseudoduganella sp. S-14]|uniref:LysM peptidoglycan-binding domain-containing protein n=1 Tax=Pseudoduganella sp. S-14 TaxID=3404065 RepID=UPI003CF5FAAE